jgi:ABC-type nitrate/sulfonate/bicarbonate transport system substrate-binding protein
MLARRTLLKLCAVGLGGAFQACVPASAPAPAPTAAPTTPPTAAPGVTTGSAKKLIVSYGSPTGSFAPLWMAKAINAFDKYGVSVDIQYIETSAAVPAIISNSIDAEEVSAAPIITADVNGGLDLVIIGSALNHPILGLYAVPDITAAEQLKGKAVASDKAGTPTDYSARLSLSLLGLKPEDVELRPIGSASEILPAMLSGQVQAGVVAPPQSFIVESKGFHLLQDIFSQPYQNTGLVAKRSRLDEFAPSLVPLLAGYRDGILAWNSQPDLAMQVQDQYAKVGDPDILRKTYDFYTKTAPFDSSLQPTVPGIKAMMDFLESSVPNVANFTPEQFVDTRFLSQLP